MSAARTIVYGISQRLQALPFFHDFTFRENQSHQVMPHELPYCAVYQLPEVSNSDGDWNAADPKFKSESIIGISVILKNIESTELEDALDGAFDVITVGLYTDAEFMALKTPSEFSIEGVSRMRRQTMFGTLGSTNETPIGELRLEMTFITRYDYPPDIRDDLNLVVLKTLYPSLEEAPSVQQVTVPMDLVTGGPGPGPYSMENKDGSITSDSASSETGSNDGSTSRKPEPSR